MRCASAVKRDYVALEAKFCCAGSAPQLSNMLQRMGNDSHTAAPQQLGMRMLGKEFAVKTWSAVTAAFTLLTDLLHGQPTWKEYVNVRFQYSICYPDSQLKTQPEAENGDGRAFLGDGGAKLLVYGSEALHQSLAHHEAI